MNFSDEAFSPYTEKIKNYIIVIIFSQKNLKNIHFSQIVNWCITEGNFNVDFAYILCRFNSIFPPSAKSEEDNFYFKLDEFNFKIIHRITNFSITNGKVHNSSTQEMDDIYIDDIMKIVANFRRHYNLKLTVCIIEKEDQIALQLWDLFRLRNEKETPENNITYFLL